MSARSSTVPFTGFAWGVLAYMLGVIVWGYFLRISESGDGCGTDWPLCHGQVVPSGAEFPTWVELTHRISSGVALILSVVLAVWARRLYEVGHAVRRTAAGVLAFTVGESLFGGMLVVLGLVATDISTARIVVRPFHVANTFLLMACLALTAWFAWRGIARVPLGWRVARPYALPVFGIGLVAVTGAWTGLAGTALPVATVGEGLAQYLSPQHALVYLRTIHPIVAVLVVVAVVRLIVWRLGSGQAQQAEKRVMGVVAAVAVAQLVVGPLTIVLLHPTGLRMLHLGLADLLWMSLLVMSAEGLTSSLSTTERSYSPRPGSERTRRGAARPS